MTTAKPQRGHTMDELDLGPVVNDDGSPTRTTLAAFGWYTLAQAAEQLGISADTLRHQVQAGRVEARLAGKTFVVSQDAIERYRSESLGRPGRRPATSYCVGCSAPIYDPLVVNHVCGPRPQGISAANSTD